MVLEIVAKHFEDYFAEGEKILICLEGLIVGRKPVIEDFDVDSPNDVIKKTGNACHNMF